MDLKAKEEQKFFEQIRLAARSAKPNAVSHGENGRIEKELFSQQASQTGINFKQHVAAISVKVSGQGQENLKPIQSFDSWTGALPPFALRNIT
jgi:hypothetical protein